MTASGWDSYSSSGPSGGVALGASATSRQVNNAIALGEGVAVTTSNTVAVRTRVGVFISYDDGRTWTLGGHEVPSRYTLAWKIGNQLMAWASRQTGTRRNPPARR